MKKSKLKIMLILSVFLALAMILCIFIFKNPKDKQEYNIDKKEAKILEIENKKTYDISSSISKKGVTSNIVRRASLELDIRGHAVDEGVHEVDAFIDNAVLSNAGLVTIIHGKGTGILRKGIQDHLRHHPSVKSFRSGAYGEGEDGVTIVELK